MSDYQMTADLGPCSEEGLRVTSGVTLDCRGHRITGSGAQSKHFGIVLASATTGATVQNCEVTEFAHGIRLREAHRNRIINNHVHGNGDSTAHVGYGIDVAHGSTENLFQGNRIHNNADEGIHIGTGSHRNTLLNNQVYDNFRENIYVLRAEKEVLKNNTVWGGGANSLFVKHAAFLEVENNTLRDRPLLIRGDAHDNRFVGNDFVNTGIHFQAYQEGSMLTRPTKNLVASGKITGAKECVRFSGASDNLLKDILLNDCAVGLSSTGDGARVENTIIGITLGPRDISLDDNSLVHVGWQLNVAVKDANGVVVSGAKVEGFDVHQNLVFSAVTAADGNIPTQDVIEYTQQGKTKTSQTPHTLRGINDQTTVTQEVTVNDNRTITISLPPAGR